MLDIDFDADRYCPVYNKEINGCLCYETIFTLSGFFKISSVPELLEIEDIEKARIICDECSHSDSL